jgi:hypothetical protein
MSISLVLLASAAAASRHSMQYSSDDLAVAEAIRVLRPVDAARYPAAQYVTQSQDHNDPANKNTWQQAFFVNDSFWQPGSDAPVFICVGGEGPPLDGSAVVDSVHCSGVAAEWLASSKALMFAVEHRYYGCHNMSACPVESFKDPVGSLKYLSSWQALQDLAGFAAFAKTKWGLTDKNKIVSFGGSYPGMLAGWFRLKFPEVVHASVASSAPVLAQLDMQGYNDVTAAAYAVGDNDVGGSAACEANIRAGHATIKNLFDTTEGRAKLSKLFGQSPSFYMSKQNQGDFAGNGVAYFPAQGNDPSCSEPGCNIKEICKIMTVAGGDPVEMLAKLSNQQASWMGARKGEKKTGEVTSGEPDYWGYQTCTEFGFYQTCEIGSKCFYAQGYVLVEDMASFCKTDYGIDIPKISANINATNKFYGGLAPAGSCILYPNGEVDPWHALSVLESPSAGIPVLMVPGASHHAWTHPSLPTDQPSVVEARTAIRSTVTGFLGQPCTVPK